MKKYRAFHTLKSPEKVLTALVKESQYNEGVDLSEYLSKDTLSIEDHEKIISEFLADVEQISIVDRQLCECQIHYWLTVRTYEDAPEMFHAMIRFEREMVKWKITDIVVPCANEETEEVQLLSIFGKEQDQDVVEAEEM